MVAKKTTAKKTPAAAHAAHAAHQAHVARTPAKKSAAAPVVPKDKLSAAQLAEQYNYAYALIQSSPELKTLFNTALTDKKGQWTAQKFAAKLRTTKWFTTHSESWRTREAERITDPTTYKANVAAKRAEVKAMAVSLGATLTPKELAAFSDQFYKLGYSSQQINDALSSHIAPPPVPGGGVAGSLQGQAGVVEEKLRDLAIRNGQSYSDAWYQKAAASIAGGSGSEQEFTDVIRNDAASKYPVFADKIAAGMDVADLASGYMKTMSQTLEIAPENVSLNDTHIKAALGGLDPKTGDPTAMGMWDFEKSLRSDPRWAATKQAKDASDSAARSILTTFGFLA